ncbi:MAG: trypsin-like peptidase domain-containing protein [Flavobacteriales bacterium]|nr:trypsin-like peptidase domain-containing protein [Flavobacteriales bacterium]
MPWSVQKRSVAIILVGGGGLCNGAMVNNTANDGTPYFLTADHCLGGNIANWVFRFNWEAPTCTNANPTNMQTVSGAVLRASNGGSNFALLELSSMPPASYNVYYAGWDKSGNFPTEQVAIHHPSGDIKKISFDDDPAAQATWGGAQCWHILDWEDGTTEGGSSGSPLFDQNHRIIGQLYGGTASCSNNIDDYYGRFDVSWDGASASSRLRDWLDPGNNATDTLNGYDPNNPTVVLDAEYVVDDVSWEALQMFDFRSFPQPTSDALTIQWNAQKSEDFEVLLISNSGQIALSESYLGVPGQNKLKFDVSALAAGNYQLVLRGENGEKVTSIVIAD